MEDDFISKEVAIGFWMIFFVFFDDVTWVGFHFNRTWKNREPGIVFFYLLLFFSFWIELWSWDRFFFFFFFWWYIYIGFLWQILGRNFVFIYYLVESFYRFSLFCFKFLSVYGFKMVMKSGSFKEPYKKGSSFLRSDKDWTMMIS